MSGNGKDRIRAHTPAHVNKRIMETTMRRIKSYARKSTAEVTTRIAKLEREWDIERVLEAGASFLIAAGLLRGFRKRLWLLLPGVVTFFLLQHSIQGWCPPMDLFRRLGVRTRKEIDFEKYALKQLRGDFAGTKGERQRAGRVLKTARA